MAIVSEFQKFVQSANGPKIPDVFLDLLDQKRAVGTLATSGIGYVFWGDDPASWDRFTIEGEIFPGLAKVHPRIKKRHDKKKAAGVSGQTITTLGSDPMELDIEVRIWTQEQWTDIQLRIEDLMPLSGKPEPVDVFHPAIAAYGVRQFIFTDFDGPTPGGEAQVYILKMKATEFRKAPTQTATAKASSLEPRGKTAQQADKARADARLAAQKPSNNVVPPKPAP
jgi:hypothetical protein